MTGAAKRIGLEVAGWALLVIGIIAIPLPGPGLLGVFAGLLLLSQQYDWAERRVEPVKMKALLGAAQGVESWPKIILSVLAALALGGAGVFWILGPADPPSWWPLPDLLWLPVSLPGHPRKGRHLTLGAELRGGPQQKSGIAWERLPLFFEGQEAVRVVHVLKVEIPVHPTGVLVPGRDGMEVRVPRGAIPMVDDLKPLEGTLEHVPTQHLSSPQMKAAVAR
jgi:hypothetical protein